MTAQIRLERLPNVLRARGVGRSTHYDDVRLGLWTPPVKASARCSAWPVHEVHALIEARVAGKSDYEIRALVAKLIADRGRNANDNMTASTALEPDSSTNLRVQR